MTMNQFESNRVLQNLLDRVRALENQLQAINVSQTILQGGTIGVSEKTYPISVSFNYPVTKDNLASTGSPPDMATVLQFNFGPVLGVGGLVFPSTGSGSPTFCSFKYDSTTNKYTYSTTAFNFKTAIESYQKKV